jgi:hypothetical protein
MSEVGGKAAIDLSRDGGRGIDQDGVALGATRQEQRAGQRIPVDGWKGDVVDKSIVECRVHG